MTTIHQIMLADDVVVGLATSNTLTDGWVEIDEAAAAQIAGLGVGRARLIDGDVEAYEPPPPPEPVLTRLAKADLWRRLTDEEAEDVNAVLLASPIRLRRLYEAATYIDTADEDYPVLRASIVDVLGEDRADVVLAPNF